MTYVERIAHNFGTTKSKLVCDTISHTNHMTLSIRMASFNGREKRNFTSHLILAGGKVTQACLSQLIKTAKNVQNFDEIMLHTV
jgi:hypothetical protein